MRDQASKTYALLLKSQLLGEDPRDVDKLFRKIKQFGHHARQAGGVCGVGMALMDLAGKAYGVPAYALAGGKFRDRQGVDYLAENVAAVRPIVGYDVPLAIDHFGHIALDSCIRIGRALEPYTPAWLEDMIPWQFTDQRRQLTASVAVPTCTGEDIYLAANFRPLLERGAVRVVHPDPATAGGILETKRLGDLAEEHGVPMALHLAATPIAMLAGVHIAAATNNFLALEHHAADLPWWSELVTGLPRPLVQDGYITVPDRPGLGFDDINKDLFREHLDPADSGLFAPTDGWDAERSHDRLWS